MSDPFSTGAGIVGVIGLAIQISQVVIQFGMDWKKAPDSVKAFMAELGTLKTVLSETNTNILLNPDFADAFQDRPSALLSQLGPGAPSTTNMKIMIEACRKELESLLNELKKNSKGHQLGWGRLKVAFLAKDTRESVENLCRQCQILNSILSIDATILGAQTYKEVRELRKEQHAWHQAETDMSWAIKDGVDQSNQWQQNQDRQRENQTILDWLTPIDYDPQHNDFLNRRQAGTGQWLLDSAEFQTWLETDEKTLFCPGIPGAGKTILTSIVVDYLCTRFQKSSNVGVAFLYCNFKRQHEQKLEDLLLSLLRQLAQRQSRMHDTIKILYDRNESERKRPTVDEIVRVLYSLTAVYSKTFIIIDALDECQFSERTKLLSEIFSLQAKTGVFVFATSRFLPEITMRFEKSMSLEIRASNEDVRKFLNGHISRLPAFVGRNPELQEEIRTEIVKAVDGMFLLAQLHLDSLVGKRSPKAIQTALKKLATGSEAYDKAYNEAMNRIKGQVTDAQELAEQVLSWITLAQRPLTTIELLHALAVEIGMSEFDEGNLSEIEDIISVCAGLITVDEESNIVRLVHYTTQEYFLRTQSHWFPDAQSDITIVCVTYLSFDDFDAGFCPTDEDFETRLESHAFYSYASRSWGHHAQRASKSQEPFIESFLERESKLPACTQAMLASKKGSWAANYSQEVPKNMIGVHIAAYFGLKEVVILLLKNRHKVDVRDGSGRTPLSWAAERGHEAVVKLLLESGADYNLKDNRGRTPLSWAAINGEEAVVKFLLEIGNVEADLKDNKSRTPLLLAAKNGHDAVVKLLLKTGNVMANSKDNEFGRTPLFWAAQNGHEAVVKLLLETGNIDADLKDDQGRTPLSWVAGRGQEAVVKLLLETGNIDVNSKDAEFGQTPLSWAAENGYEAVVTLLLKTGNVDVDSKDHESRTPLSWAAGEGQEAVVKLLLETGAESNLKDKRGQTPLSRAAERGNKAVVKLLLETGADYNLQDNRGQTPLSRAAMNREEAMVKFLLEIGAEYNLKDEEGRTPLSWAAENGYKAVVKLLLESGAEYNLKDEMGGTPLSWAAQNGHEAVVKLLLETDNIDADLKDDQGRTPLSRAAGNGHAAVVMLLLATGQVDIDSKDFYNSTPLSLAVRLGRKEVVELLLTRDLGLTITDKFGRSPLYWARKSGHLYIVDLLLKKFEEYGIVIQEDESLATTISATCGESDRICDVCMFDILENDSYYHCRVCLNGDFDICRECSAIKAHCLDALHILVKMIQNDNKIGYSDWVKQTMLK